MDRRWFLGASMVGGASVLLASGHKKEREVPDSALCVIEAVQQHMFPEGSLLPSAQTFHASEFLAETIIHPAYDKDIRKFVIEGAMELQSREKQHFLAYDTERKEKALRAYEETSYGSGWLDRIMLLSLEGLLSDPLYGGNFGQSGWKALHTKGGDPHPSTRY
ncbi:MAG TPA: gluconate 2-dehydrogenase subunit 3 family protein, partial [Epsilonproteobacteria bacterium]|nr:gluconate 2-dehydrogenase subunit 3 family protein [Campylobacterota bacterium]